MYKLYKLNGNSKWYPNRPKTIKREFLPDPKSNAFKLCQETCRSEIHCSYIEWLGGLLELKNTHGVFVMDARDRLVAFVIGAIHTVRGANLKIMHLKLVCGTGFGEYLIKSIMQRAIDRACDYIVLEAGNSDLIPYYKRYGFHGYWELKYREKEPRLGLFVRSPATQRKRKWWSVAKSSAEDTKVPRKGKRFCHMHRNDKKYQSRSDRYMKALKDTYDPKKALFDIRRLVHSDLFMWRTTPERVTMTYPKLSGEELSLREYEKRRF